jgi:hypothetical protein
MAWRWSGKTQTAFVSNGRRALDRTINLPQAFNVFDEKLTGPVGQHDREEKYPTFDFWAPISRHRRSMA